jgi:hypothetical protein
MGQYNPHAPYIIGEEWVPIRDARYTPEEFVERGYTFRLDHSATPVTGAYYVVEVPQSRVNQACDLIGVYPIDQEQLSGPIKKINIPVSAISVSGTSFTTTAGYQGLLNPSDDSGIRFNAPSDSNSFLAISFDFASYSQQLMGKRILDVSIRYSLATGSSTNGGTAADAAQIGVNIGFLKDMFGQSITYSFFPLDTTVVGAKTEVSKFSITDLDPFWDATRSPHLVRDIYPWRYQELSRFAATAPAANRMVLQFFNGITSSNSAWLYFVDMEITYCEETRVLYGGRRTTNFNVGPSGVYTDNYEVGPNLVRLLDTNFATATTALTPGDYAVTLMHNDLLIPSGQNGAPKVAALRELYQLEPQRGFNLAQSLTVDDQFTITDSPVLTELTLHTASAVVTGVHPYGIQDDIPVYGTITAIQEIEDDPVGTAKSYPQVRFYARRFGNTGVPLTLVDVATGLSTVSISVQEFDALPEIVDGWREVNLRFTTAPTFATAAGDVDWRWQASGELARNQWQVLGMGSQTFAAHSIGPASYYAPQGNTVDLTWQSPVISGTAEDTLSDAVIIFSTDPPSVTGFAISTQSQAITGITSGCVPARCVPSAIQYNQMTWTVGSVGDEFERTSAVGWGVATTGQTWTMTLDGVGGTTSVANGRGRSTSAIAGGTNYGHVTSPGADTYQRMQIFTPAIATGATQVIEIEARYTSIANYYSVQVLPDTTGLLTVRFLKVVASVGTIFGPSVSTIPYASNQAINIVFAVVGSRLSAKVWIGTDAPEPAGWTIEVTDTALTATGSNGVRLGTSGGNTNTMPFTMEIDNYCTNVASIAGGSIEIQRSDTIDTDWQTIMLTEDLCTVSFRDFEARVGVPTSYRIRTLNVLDFAGSWVTGSGSPITIASPGVTIGGSGNSVLIFTSNEDPTANLAYTMQWESQPIETFAFPEANEVQLQRMYGKDFFTAFHPLERGGDQFTRVLLVNAAAIPVPSLANFRGLRDLAWASLNYVCVRDELGNRWFANIIVPDGNARLDRAIYMAQIQVSEVTDTPTPIAEVP